MTNPDPDVTGTVLEDASPELCRVYAEALLGAATHANETQAVVDELEELVADVWSGPRSLGQLLASPSIDAAEKDRLLLRVLDNRTRPTTLNFLRVLNRKGRLELLPSIVHRAAAEWNRRLGRVPVAVRSAVPLDKAQQAALTAKLHTLLDATPILKLDVDPSLIGGMVVQVGDVVYDASVRSRHLEQLRRKLLQERTHEVLARRAQFTSS